MPMNLILPSPRNATSSPTESFSSRVAREGLAWNCTTSRWSVRIRLRLCSTPARTFARVNTCSPNPPVPPSGCTAQPHLLARKNWSRR